MTTDAPEIEPDRDAMRRHVELVFGSGFDGALDGLVELAWTDAVTGSLRNAQLFGTDQLEELVDRAAELNRIERCNVYVGAALRKPETPPAKRTADSDFHSAPFAWADIDDDCVEAAIKAAKAAGVPATMTVVTGRHPHMRAQFWKHSSILSVRSPYTQSRKRFRTHSWPTSKSDNYATVAVFFIYTPQHI